MTTNNADLIGHNYCQACRCPLPADSSLALICSHACTFCQACDRARLHGVCPNCAGELLPRPVRGKINTASHAALAPTSTNITITIATATPADLDALAVLFDAYRVFYQQPSDIAGAKQFLASRMQLAQSHILLAKHVDDHQQTNYCGFAQLYPFFSSVQMRTALLLNDLYVAPKFRKLGVASALLEQACAYAKAQQTGWLTLSTAIDNQAARALYRRSGWLHERDFCVYNWQGL